MDFDNKLDPSTITDVETAKLALRWAVEKIHALSDDAARLKEDNRNKTNLARTLTQQAEQKDEVLKKWQTTIKTWEENWRTQTAMEADLKAKLREQILNEETANWRQARAQLENETKALKGELSSKEAEIGKLKLLAIDEIRKAAELKEAETQALILGRQEALGEQERAMRSRFELMEKELVENHRLKIELDELSLKERYEVKMREFSRLYQDKENQLEDFRQKLEKEYQEKSEALSAARTVRLEEERKTLAAAQEAAAAETARGSEKRLAELQAEFDRQRAALHADFKAREESFAASKASETAFIKEAHQKEMSDLRDRLRQQTQQREQEYVDLRMQMESQLLELVKKHDEAGAEAFNAAAQETRDAWSRLAVNNQKKLDAIIAGINARWEKDWAGREEALAAQIETRVGEERERLVAAAAAKEEALRRSLLREQNELSARAALETERAKQDLEKAYEERLAHVKLELEETHRLKEKTLEDRLSAREKTLASAWQVKEEAWTLERERALLEERERCKDEFAGYRAILKEKLLQFEDELKLKYAHKELELADKFKEEAAGREQELEKRLAAEKQRLEAEADGRKKALARREAEIEKAQEEARKSVESEKAAFENHIAERGRKTLAGAEQALAGKYSRLESELGRAIAEREAALAARGEEMRLACDARLKEEKARLEEANRARELHIKAQESELEKLKNSLERQHSELKVRLYQELQAKEQEQFSQLAKAKEEMYEALNKHRAAMDAEYAQRFTDLRRQETELETRAGEKLKERMEALVRQKDDETEKITFDFETRREELDRNYQNKEKALRAELSERAAMLEAESARREKDRSALDEKSLAKRREELENLMRQKEGDLEKRYLQQAADLAAESNKQRIHWESHKADVLDQERQGMRSEFEKKEALLTQKLDEELARGKQQRLRLEEEFSAKKNDLERSYYMEMEKSRTALDKLRIEMENKTKAKFRELEEEKTRLTMLTAQKEEEYVTQHQKKEEELLKFWARKQQELQLKYEKALKQEKDKK